MMNALKIILITIITPALGLTLAYGAPKEDKENNRGQERSESVHAAHQNAQHENLRGLNQGTQRNLLRQEQSRQERSRWWYNPNDDRGQGNMGKVMMLSPYGHDKDSDRMKLYGNRGRVIKTEPTPEPPPPDPTPTPEPTPEPPPPDPTPTPEPTPEPPPNYPPF
jgi:hypothetical protein